MARKQVLISDLSGEPIAESEAVRVTIQSANGGKRFELDAAASEVAKLVASAREVKKRGRPKTKA
jgi:hypothetical protein